MNPLKAGIIKNALQSDRMTSILMKTVPRIDRRLMKLSRGWVNTAMQSVALIETIGAKTGLSREIITLCMPVGDDLYLVGSNWGRKQPPGWYFNLKAHPDINVTFRGYKGRMHAEQLSPQQHDALWPQLIEYNPQYQHYQNGCERTLPVMHLSRI